VEATSTTRYSRSHSNLDNAGGVGGDDPNRWIRNEEFFTRGDVSAKLLNKTLTPSAYVSYTRHTLDDTNRPDAVSLDSLDSQFHGDIVTVGSRAKWAPADAFSAVVGGETQGERADSYYRSDGAWGPYEDYLYGTGARTNSAYLESKVSYNSRAWIDAGVRHDHHSIFGGKTTFKVAPAVIVTDGTKLRGSVGTGFKAPSLVQLYSSYGNKDLQAETSTGWDVGVDQDIVKETVSTFFTFFRTSYNDLITFNPSTYILENITQSYAQGCEIGSNIEATDSLSLRIAYTYTDTENETTGESLLRRPRNKNSLSLVYAPTEKVRAQLQWRVYSSRFDNNFNTNPPSRVSLGGYGIVDVAISYRILDSVELFTRVDNLFDKEYQEVLGFGTMGAAAYAGVRLEM
jgi:vitamin B12 transporter